VVLKILMMISEGGFRFRGEDGDSDGSGNDEEKVVKVVMVKGGGGLRWW
jgi:hypothetical protein